MKPTLIAGALLASALCAGAAQAQTAPAMAAQTSKGQALVDKHNMTLYVFSKDEAGKSNCTGQCATNWPPFAADAGAKASGKWSIIERADGMRQWAYEGKPLYTFRKDMKAGDADGEGIGGNWHMAKP